MRLACALPPAFIIFTKVADMRLRTKGAWLPIVAALGMAAPGASALAQEADASNWGVGALAGTQRKPYRDYDDKALLVPLITFENRWVRLQGPELDVKLYQAGPASLRWRSRLGMEGYKAKDSPRLRGMAERKGGLWTGAAAVAQLGAYQVSTELLADASGHSKGSQWGLQVEQRIQAGPWAVTPRVAAHWVNGKYANYYYGVLASEARAGRAQYTAGATTNLELGLQVDYSPAQRHLVFADLSTQRLGGTIKDSPLVQRSSVSQLRLGYHYSF